MRALRVRSFPGWSAAVLPRVRRLSARRVVRYLWALPLETRFLVFSLVVLVTGALVIGGWVSRAIRDGVLARSGATSALYAESFLGPELRDESVDAPLSPEVVQRLDKLFASTRFGERVVSFKLWGPTGVVRYARDDRLIGSVFPIDDALARAFDGEVVSRISNLSAAENEYEADRWTELVETYAPVRSSETGEVYAAAEFYELPDELLTAVGEAQRTGWLIVGAATMVMFLLLNGMVRGASRTIGRQNVSLRDLSDRLRRASAQKVETDEEVFRRVSQDLHDGPAQDLALANLRIGAVQKATRDSAAATDVDRIAEAVDRALAGIREISAEMRLPELSGLSFRAVVLLAADEHERRSGETVEVLGDDGAFVPDGPAATTIYRVVTEALNNAALHAGPGRRRVTFDSGEHGCRIRIEDDGHGFIPASAPEGLGIRGMRERAEVLGGRLSVRSWPGRGTAVELVLPETTQ